MHEGDYYLYICYLANKVLLFSSFLIGRSTASSHRLLSYSLRIKVRCIVYIWTVFMQQFNYDEQQTMRQR